MRYPFALEQCLRELGNDAGQEVSAKVAKQVPPARFLQWDLADRLL